MRRTRLWAWALVPVLVLGVVTALEGNVAPAQADGVTRQIASGGTTTFRETPTGSDAIQFPEFVGEPRKEEATAVDRSLSQGLRGSGSAVPSAKVKSSPQLVRSFDGLIHRDQRLANNGNQFSVEPPDQGLCAGNGFVLESVNDVLRVYDRSGNARTGVVDLNTFYGYPPAINRTTGTFGPFVTDPSCHFDPDTQRWFNVVLTLEVVPANGAFTGPNHIDIAVSKTADPTGAWTIYRLPVQNDGTQGTPNHRPQIDASHLSGRIIKQGQFGVADNHLTYPAVGVTASGRGVIAFTLVGADHYPSAAYASLDSTAGTGPVQVAREGLGPSDGFTSYKSFVGAPPRTRWGDYGAAAVDGSSIWIGSEYIGQTCTLAQWLAAPIGSCGATRTALANWYTRISLIKP